MAADEILDLNWFRSHCFEIVSARRDSLNEDYGSKETCSRSKLTFDEEKLFWPRHRILI